MLSIPNLTHFVTFKNAKKPNFEKEVYDKDHSRRLVVLRAAIKSFAGYTE